MTTLDRVKFLILRREIEKTEVVDEEIRKLLSVIFEDLATLSYEEAKAIRLELFDISENHHELFFCFLLLILEDQLQLLSQLSFEDDPQKLINIENREHLENLLFTLMETQLSRGWNRLSTSQISLEEISPEDREPLFSLILQVAQFDKNIFAWDIDELRGILVALSVGRQLSFATGKIGIFYAALTVVIQKLHYSRNYQMSLDFAEEAFFTSLLDNQRGWGYLALFIAFNMQFNVNNALIYAIACTASIIRKAESKSGLLVKRLLFTVQRFYRNSRFIDHADSLYHSTLKKLPLSQTEFFDITHTHFTVQLIKKSPGVISEVYEYLVSNKEIIFSGDRSIAVPLLNTIHEIRRVFAEHQDISMLDDYAYILEQIVGEDVANRVETIAYGNTPDIKDIYIDMLSRFRAIRNADDFVSGTHECSVVADKLVIYSITAQDIEAFLLSMIFKADYSWVFIEKKLENNLIEIENSITTMPSPVEYSSYDNHILESLRLGQEHEFIWLAESTDKVFYTSLFNDKYAKISSSQNWNMSVMNQWLSLRFSSLSFDETVSRGGQIEQYLEDDQLLDLNKIKAEVSFATINTSTSKAIVVVKDMALSEFPHNLISDGNGDLISRNKPIACLPSTEWYIRALNSRPALGRAFTTSLWIPADSGDYALNLLWSRLQPALNEFRVTVSNDVLPKNPLSADVNVLIAHGASDISSSHTFFAGQDNLILNVDGLITRGNILILFVCHSGSMKKALFREKILSLVKAFFNKGYRAVIAPFWSLHISVPPVWLPAFLTSLKNEMTVSEAVFSANSKVYETNKNPGAWACLHLYGDPYLKVE